MKTIEQASRDFERQFGFNSIGEINATHEEAFKAGVQFAEEWIDVNDELPEEASFNMSNDVLTLSGSMCSVKRYDYELKCWTGSPHVTVTHWRPINRK